MYTGSAKDAEYYVEAFKLLVFSRPVTLSSFDVRHCRGQRCCYRPFCVNIPTLYPRPSTVTTTEEGISRFRLEACTSMYGTVALQAQTSRAEHERHTTLGFLAACSSTIKPVEYRATSRIFSPILHHATHVLPQPRHTYVDLVAVTHDFLKTPLMPSPGS